MHVYITKTLTMSQYLLNVNTALSDWPSEPATRYKTASEVLETKVLENPRNVFRVELLEEFPTDVVNARTVIIEWCINDPADTDYRFMISRMDHTNVSDRAPERLRRACRDIDVYYDDVEEEILIRYRYMGEYGHDKTGIICASYFRPIEKFIPHTHINQKEALQKFLQTCARRTGSREELVWGEVRLFDNYQASKPQHVPNVALSSEPAEIYDHVEKMQEKWMTIHNKVKEVDKLVQEMLSL